MSNYLAIATVTAAMRQFLQTTLDDAANPPGVAVNTLRPNGNGGASEAAAVNIFLYQVTPNAALQNADLPTRRAGGDVVQRPRAALDLHYLLTFHGDDSLLEPQYILGSTVRALHARPLLTRDLIRDVVKSSETLKTSNLADAVELVRFTPESLSLEDLSKLWSIYFQTPYSLSIAYRASVVLIESEESTHAALPVASRNIYVVPFRRPTIEEIRSAGDAEAPIAPQSPIVVSGKRLRGEVTQVQIDDLPPIINFTSMSDTEIKVDLPSGLPAGVHGLQVVQPFKMGTPPVDHDGTASNLFPFVLHPLIQGVTLGASDITVTVEPDVGEAQRAVLLMNGPRAYSFDATARTASSLTFAINGVKAGDYLLRVQIDGADSPLERDTAGLYVGPKVTIA